MTPPEPPVFDEPQVFDEPWQADAFAICADPLPGLMQVDKTSVKDLSSKGISAQCPLGKELLRTVKSMAEVKVVRRWAPERLRQASTSAPKPADKPELPGPNEVEPTK